MNIEIWSIGKESEGYIDAGVQLYLKKTQPYAAISIAIINIPKKAQTTDEAKTRKAEEELVISKLQSQHYLILLDERGKLMSSEEWAGSMQQVMNRSVKTIVFLIGGAFGVTDAVRSRAAEVWSLSKLVFPHQLVRLIVAEQLYRAHSILNGSPYHHA
jgi:23S rRNA (pseudouridine1915-N3)-methyltransferase